MDVVARFEGVGTDAVGRQGTRMAVTAEQKAQKPNCTSRAAVGDALVVGANPLVSK
jgi:hypothetical protein